MSTSLYWLPPPIEPNHRGVGFLKYEIGKYFEEDYNGGSGEWIADVDMIPFLKGIYAVGSDDQKRNAQELMEAITKYGKVILTIY